MFGLPRRKQAGTSYRESLHGQLWFVDQQSVDEYVTMGHKPHKREDKEGLAFILFPQCCFIGYIGCSDFKAGDALRSATRFHKLDETALFGSACRHEIPVVFFNLKHGER